MISLSSRNKQQRGGMTSQLLLTFLLFCSCIHLSCCISGWIEPSVVKAALGDKVTLLCGVDGFDENEEPSKMLTFFNQTSGLTIDSRFVRILNRTTAELTLPKVPEQITTIYCKYGSQGVTTVDLFVGHKPDNISKVNCHSYNWLDLNCSFTIPDNHLAVQYELKYYQGEMNDKSNFRQLYDCESVTKVNNVFSCRFSEIKYRRVAKTFTFELTASNTLETTKQKFEFDNFKNIIPDAPTKFEKGESSTKNSIFTTWKMPVGKLGALEEKFDFEISVNSECSGEKRFLLREFYSGEGPKNFSYHIPLDYSHIWYVIRIRMKISRADNVEVMWSPWASLNQNVQLAAREPDFPPEVNVGGFNILPNNDVYIYWKNVNDCFHNGKSFTYDVSSERGGPTELKESFAIYRKNVRLSNYGADIRIRSQNSVGLSTSASVMRIPSDSERLSKPKAIKKRYVTENTTYVLTWSPPDSYLDVTSYTVFWCKSKTEGENKCDDKSFDFTVINATEQRIFKHKSDETVNFAISANSKTSTSGMYWTTCTTGESKEIGKIRSVWIPRLTSTEIDIEWKLECTDKGIVVGYEIEYCLASASKKFECIGPVEKKNLTGQLEDTKYRLSDLTPYKTYGIVIRMFSSSTMGPSSDPLVNTTLPDAPSSVRELLPRNIGNTSVLLKWMPPEHFNGVLVYYDISINENQNRSDAPTNASANEPITYTWNDLEPFQMHNVAVRACTNKCSNWTKSFFTTEMGAPGPFKEQPRVESSSKTPSLFNSNSNSSSQVLKWQQPIYKGGYLDFYEVKFELSPNDGRNEPTTKIYKMKSTQCIFDICSIHKTGSVTLYVRGVNFFLSPHRSDEVANINVHDEIKGSEIAQTQCNMDDAVLMESLEKIKKYDNHSQFFYGPWSPQNSHSCSGDYSSQESQNVILVMFLSFVSILFVFMIYYLFRKIREIKNIIVEFPPGLEELSGDKIIKKNKSNPSEVPDILHNVDNTSLANEDEHKRLLKRHNGSLNGGDCNSSINSEITRSDIDQNDDIEYNDLGGSKQYEVSDNDNIDGRLQSFLLNPTTGKEVTPILVSHEPLPSSNIRESPKPHIIMNPSDSTTATSSSGYVTAPSPSNIQVNGNGYVTPSMFSPIQTQPQSNGYTQLNRFGKPIINNDRIAADKMNMNLKTPMVVTTDQNGISGYVTHKQLADYGHRMQ